MQFRIVPYCIILFVVCFSARAQVQFTEEAVLSGISNEGYNYGISFGDYDGDGDEDVYISRYNESNILYKNLGSGFFQDVTTVSGTGYNGKTFMSVWGDLDNDGDLDLFVANSGSENNIYYENQGDGTFSDRTSEAGLNNYKKSRTVLLGDLDNDGWIDIYLANNNAQNSLMHNNGDGTFSDIIEESGAKDTMIAMGAILFDYDNDNDLDIYLTHDDYQDYILYRNEGNMQFTDVSVEAGVNYAGLGMGVDAGDYNNDGYQDLYISNMLENVLYLNNGDGTFSDVTEQAGVGDDGMGWGVSWLDYDNDGWQDIYLVNDSDFFDNPNILYRNNADGTFTNVSDDTSLMSEYESYGLGTTDLNDDGMIDILVANRDRTNELFLNASTENNWIKIKAIGENNLSALGATIRISVGEDKFMDQVTGGSGYSSQNSPVIHFGLGEYEIIDEIRILWPQGHEDIYENVEANRYYVAKEMGGLTNHEDEFLPCDFQEIMESKGIRNPDKNWGVAFCDFDNDGDDDYYISKMGGFKNLLFRNLGDHKYIEIAENLGLDVAGETVTSIWGDINNDGFEDLYLGQKDSDKLFLNNGGEGFTEITQAAGISDRFRPNSVNMADVNGDGLLDIYVANLGGQNILYRNNGDLTFTDIISESRAIDTKVAMGAIFFDYDEDGDQDLYLTHDGRQKFILYKNDGTGKFVNASDESGLGYEGYGMGVDVGDYNNDGHLDVYITDFYENILFKNNGDGTFTNVSNEAGVEDLGMGWGTVFADIDNDGWQDIYVANNSYFSPYPNILYRNKGDGSFEELCDDSELMSMGGANGLAASDLNLDGTVDFIVANDDNMGNELFVNQNSNNSWIKFKAIGTTSNRSAIGTRVVVSSGGRITADEVNAGSSYASQNSSFLHFGLSTNRTLDQVTFHWPSGLVEAYENLDANQLYYVKEGEGIVDRDDIQNIITSTEFPVTEESIGFYPNPSGNSLNLKTDNSEQFVLSIYDLKGKEMLRLSGRPVSSNGQTVTIPGWEALRPGVYLYRLSLNKTVHSGKLIKDRQ